MIVLMVAILIIGVFLFPGLRSHPMSRRACCASNLRQIGISLNIYAQDNAEKLPIIPDTSSSTLVGTDINQTNSVNNGQSPWRNLQLNAVDNHFCPIFQREFYRSHQNPNRLRLRLVAMPMQHGNSESIYLPAQQRQIKDR
jgi:hypothetical protein